MYRFYGNSEFKLGNRIRVADCCGLDSNKHGIVINHFPWQEEEGAYKQPAKHYVPVMLDDKTKHYFSRRMLLHENKQYNVRVTDRCIIYSLKN